MNDWLGYASNNPNSLTLLIPLYYNLAGIISPLYDGIAYTGFAASVWSSFVMQNEQGTEDVRAYHFWGQSHLVVPTDGNHLNDSFSLRLHQNHSPLLTKILMYDTIK